MPKAPTGRDFYVATPEEIRDGRTTDVYFLRTLDILKKAGQDRTRVVAEVTAGTLPNGWPWGILCGVEEAVHLLAGKAVSLWSLPEVSLIPAVGTMPHALVIVMGGPREAFAAVHKFLEEKVPRIALVDTYYDEKTEALLAVEAIPDLTGVRLDTPASRRGNFPAIVREVRWELDLRGHKDVQIFVSGSVDEKTIPALVEAGVDGFGVGTSLSNAPTIDFAMDIVEVEGKPAAKRGKFGGRKDLQRCPKDGTYEVGVRTCAVCGSKTVPAYVRYLDNGRPSTPLPSLADIRRRTAEELSRAALEI